MRKNEIVDPYATARFGSLWQVVVHATEQDEDRHAVYAEACQSMLDTGAWREYRLVYFALRSGYKIHVGYRFARPTDWFTVTREGVTEGPYKSKRIILRKHRVRTAQKQASGIYKIDGYLLFTRANAETLGINPEELP
jgi:hypothetical protein